MPWDNPPLKLLAAVNHAAEDKRFFLSEHLLNVGMANAYLAFASPSPSLPKQKAEDALIALAHISAGQEPPNPRTLSNKEILELAKAYAMPLAELDEEASE